MYGGSSYSVLPYGVSEAAQIGAPKATIPSSGAFDVGSDEFCFEITATSDTIETGESVLVSNYASVSPSDSSLEILRDGNTLKLYLSSDGTNWDIASAVSIGTITVSKFYLTIELIGNEYVVFLDGGETARIYSVDRIYAAGNDFIIGAYDDDSSPWYGTVHAWRWRVGGYRYGSEHQATEDPFADSGSYTEGTVYSDNFALFMGDVAASPVYGPGASLDGLSDAKAWCLELLGDDATPQGLGGIVFNSNRRFEAWMNLLGEYAACLWFPYGADIRLQPDSAIGADRASGQDICEHGEFDADIGWTVNDWVIGSGVASVDGSQGAATSLTRSMATEHLGEYSVQVDIASLSAGSLSVEIDGQEVIAGVVAAGVYRGAYTADDVANDIAIIASSDAVVSVNSVAVRRLSWLQTHWVKSSLRINGHSTRDRPNRVGVKHLLPEEGSPDWSYDPEQSVAVWPGADAGALQLISTEVDMPGLPTKAQADNRAVRKLHRMDSRNEYRFIGPDAAVLWRKGDVVDLKRTLRGLSVRIWIESVEMRGYGRYAVTGTDYSPLHHTMSTEYEHPFYYPPYSGSPVDGEYGAPYADYPSYGSPGDDFILHECQPYSCSAFVAAARDLGFEIADFADFQGAATLPEYLSLSDGSSSQIRVGPNYLSNVGSGMPVAPCSSYWTIEAGDIDQCESFIRGVVVPAQVNSPGSTNITKFTSPYKSLVFLHKGGLSSGWSAVSSLLGFKMYFDYAEVGDSSGSSSVAFDLKWSPPSLGGVGFSWHAGGSGGFFGAPTWAGGVNYTAVSIDVGAVYLEPEYQGPQNNPWHIDAYVDVVFSAVTSVGVFTHTIKYKFFGVASTGPDNLTISNVYFGDSSLFAGAGANLFCLGGSAEVDLDKLQALIYAHQRNFADYQLPAYCPVY